MVRTSDNPYTPAQAELREEDLRGRLPSPMRQTWMSLVCCYAGLLPTMLLEPVLLGAPGAGSFDLLDPILVGLLGSAIVVPTWAMLFLPIVLTTDPRSRFVEPLPLLAIGSLAGAGWSLVAQPMFAGGAWFLILVIGGATAGFTYGAWNRGFLGREP